MDIKDALWKLDNLGDTVALDAEVRKAIKEAYRVLNDVRNMMDLPGHADTTCIITEVQKLKTSAVGDAFKPKNIATSVANLQDRFNHLGDWLTECNGQEQAAPLEGERRIIKAALSAVDAEYGAQYFKG